MPGGAQPTSTDYSSAQAAGISILASYASSALGKFGLGPTGTGRMAARGQAAEAAKQARYESARQSLRYRADTALHAFEQQGVGPGDLLTFNPDPIVQKLGQQIVAYKEKLGAAKTEKQARKIEARIEKKQARQQRRELHEAAKEDIRVSARYGPNSGYWREFNAPPPLWLTQGSH